MATIAGVFSFTPSPAAAGERDIREPGLAMAGRGPCVWGPRGREVSVARGASGLAIAWDGRLDNAGDLRLRLGDPGLRSDADVVLAVVARWGAGALEWLLGDWSLALWDGTRRTLHLARDYMGVRPLYYCCAGDSAVAWSSDLAELVDRCDRRDALSAAFAARFMSLSPGGGLTPYEGVHAVPPGACLSFISTGACTMTRLWTLGTGDIRWSDRRRYEEELRALWRTPSERACEPKGPSGPS